MKAVTTYLVDQMWKGVRYDGSAYYVSKEVAQRNADKARAADRDTGEYGTDYVVTTITPAEQRRRWEEQLDSMAEPFHR